MLMYNVHINIISYFLYNVLLTRPCVKLDAIVERKIDRIPDLERVCVEGEGSSETILF